MSQIVNISHCDVVFLSYDEPNAEENYSNLLAKIPWAQRVHGVEGSDAAHKACAKLSTTDRLIIIDGDNFLVKDNFLNQKIEVEDDSVDLSRSVLSWPSTNIINGLVYGNGGIKCWPTELILNMKTHEQADLNNLRAQIDFCWDIKYIPFDTAYSEIRNNATPLQAWRAGFREGVKMSLNEGLKVNNLSSLWKGNLDRLLIWMSIGQDVKNGIWAILGARQGCYLTNCTDWNYIKVRDFAWLNEYWKNYVEHLTEKDVLNEIEKLGKNLKEVIDIPECFTSNQSRFFKKFNFNPNRQSKTVKVL